MFKAKDTIVGLLDKVYGDYRFYEVLKVYKGEHIYLYDIRAISTGIIYHKVPLPDEFYKKIDKAR
jgi:hypothetical protein